VGFKPSSVRLNQDEIMKIYQDGWNSGRMGQLSKQYFNSDIEARWKQDSTNYRFIKP